MAQDWLVLLDSEDPKDRAEAIKQIALSGNKDNLYYLKEIVENDPDPRVKEYAKKAARHLYSADSTPKPEQQPEKPATAAPTTISQEIREQAAQVPNGSNAVHPIPKKKRDSADSKVQRALSLYMAGQKEKARKQLIQALDLNPYLADETFVKGVAAEITGQPSNYAIKALTDPLMSEEKAVPEDDLNSLREATTGLTSPQAEEEEEEDGPTRTKLIQAWLSFFGMTEDFFKAEAKKANGEDTLLSVLVATIAAVVIFMITGFFQFQQIMTLINQQLPAMGTEMPPINFNIGIVFFVILIGTVIMTPISFYATVGLQYLGSRIFGGSGTFKTHAYLMALVQVPITIVSGIISLVAYIPLIGLIAGLAGFGLSIYTIILTVRLVKAAHKLETGRAVAAIIVPPIVISAVFGCLALTVGSSLLGSLMQVQ